MGRNKSLCALAAAGIGARMHAVGALVVVIGLRTKRKRSRHQIFVIQQINAFKLFPCSFSSFCQRLLFSQYNSIFEFRK